MADPPTDLMVVAVSSNSIQVDWTDNSSDETGFTIEMSTEEFSGFFEKGTVGANVTTFLADDLPSAETEYFFRVTKTGETDYTTTESATTLSPEPPTNLVAGTITAITVDLSWDDNTEFETGYWIERSDDGGMNFSFVGDTDADDNEYTDPGLTGSTDYQYRVAARLGPSELTDYSNIVMVTTAAPDLPDAPNNLSAEAQGTSQITITWNDRSDNETGFRIERSDFIDDFYVETGEVGANVTTFTSTDLEPNSTYFFRVVAFNDEGESDPSGSADAKTDIGAPEAATDLDTTFVDASQIIITWSDNSSFETGYRVEIASFGDFSTVSTLEADAETDTITDLQEVTLYTIRVVAFNDSGETPSDEIQVATTQDKPAAPSDLTFTLNNDGDRIRLTWTDNSDNEEGFIVQRSDGNTENFDFLDETDVDEANFTDDLEPGVNFFYRVRAFNAGGNSKFTNITSNVLASAARELAEKSLSVYPNPSNGMVQISMENGAISSRDIRVYNYTGKLVQLVANDQTSGPIALNLTDQPAGLYFLEFEVGDYTIRRKLLLTR